MDVLVASALVLWFGLTVIDQFRPRWFERVQAWDLFGLLPHWTFFAPNPGHSDYHLVYRDRRQNGSVSPWDEVTTLDPRTPYTFVWNPGKRRSKVIVDAASTLAGQGIEDKDERILMLSLPYLILLNLVLAIGGDPHSSRQFAVVETFGDQSPRSMRVLAVSDFHALGSP